MIQWDNDLFNHWNEHPEWSEASACNVWGDDETIEFT